MVETRGARLTAIGVGGLGLALALLLEADLWLSSGIWYPVVYAGTPAIAGTAAFAHERPDVSPGGLLGVGGWILVTSVLALAVAVVLSLGFPSESPQSPVSAVLSAGVLYLGFLLVPVGFARIAARHRGLRTALALAAAPVGQAIVAATLVLAR